MAKIKLSGVKATSKARVEKSAVGSKSERYKAVTEEANKRIDKSQRRYASAYQRAAGFLAR